MAPNQPFMSDIVLCKRTIMELKFKSSGMINLLVALFCSCGVTILFAFGFIVSSIAGQSERNILALEIFGSIFLAIWIIYFIATFLFYKTIVVTEEKITLKRWKKILWSLNKEDISECVYQRLTGFNFYRLNAATMLFRLKDTKKFAVHKISKNFSTPYYITLSYKNVKKMLELGYSIRIIDSIHEQ